MDARRQHILAVVIKHLRANVEGLEDRDIDPALSMMDYGASSLDLVEIVSSVSRELNVTAARTQLAAVKNIDELVAMYEQLTAAAS